MRKLLYILIFTLSSNISIAQVYEIGASYHLGQFFGEQEPSFDLNLQNLGVAIKKNMNPRMSYRLTANFLKNNNTSIKEFAAGIDFNFNKYNLVRANGLNRSTPYVILEVATILMSNESLSNKFAMVLPMGIGYKKSLTPNLNIALEAKGRIALSDQLVIGDINQNSTTFDAYYYTGFTLFYTFGWPRGSENQTRF